MPLVVVVVVSEDVSVVVDVADDVTVVVEVKDVVMVLVEVLDEVGVDVDVIVDVTVLVVLTDEVSVVVVLAELVWVVVHTSNRPGQHVSSTIQLSSHLHSSKEVPSMSIVRGSELPHRPIHSSRSNGKEEGDVVSVVVVVIDVVSVVVVGVVTGQKCSYPAQQLDLRTSSGSEQTDS